MNIQISHEANDYIERLFYEYNTDMNILRYIASQDSVNQDSLKYYWDRTEEKGVELELAKSEASDKYCPKDMQGKDYNYNFDFKNCCIIYTVVGE